jgi:hypothetical protein
VAAGTVSNFRVALPPQGVADGIRTVNLSRRLFFRHEIDGRGQILATVLRLFTVAGEGPLAETARIEFHGDTPAIQVEVRGHVASEVAGSERLVLLIDTRDARHVQAAARLQAAAAQSGGRWHLWPVASESSDGQQFVRVALTRLGTTPAVVPLALAGVGAVSGTDALERLAAFASTDPAVLPSAWLAGRTPELRWPMPVGALVLVSALAIGGWQWRRRRDSARTPS